MLGYELVLCFHVLRTLGGSRGGEYAMGKARIGEERELTSDMVVGGNRGPLYGSGFRSHDHQRWAEQFNDGGESMRLTVLLGELL